MTLEDIIDVRAIEQLKYRYIRAVDTHDWPLMMTCLSDDAEVWYNNGMYSFSGKRDILRFFEDVITPSFVSSHIAVHPEITLTGPGTATGVWRLQDIVHFTAANPNAKEAEIHGGEKMEGAAYYYDEYRKAQDAWVISRTGYVRLFETIQKIDLSGSDQLKVEPLRGVRGQAQT